MNWQNAGYMNVNSSMPLVWRPGMVGQFLEIVLGVWTYAIAGLGPGAPSPRAGLTGA